MDEFKYVSKHIAELGPKTPCFNFIFVFMKFIKYSRK